MNDILVKNNNEISTSLCSCIATSLATQEAIAHALRILDDSRAIAKKEGYKLKEKSYRDLQERANLINSHVKGLVGALKNCMGIDDIDPQMREEIEEFYIEVYSRLSK